VSDQKKKRIHFGREQRNKRIYSRTASLFLRAAEADAILPSATRRWDARISSAETLNRKRGSYTTKIAVLFL